MKHGVRNKSFEAFQRARQLRSDMSISEKWLWERLRQNQLGFKFRRQVPVGPYVLDFYAPEASVCVEIDGEQHAQRLPQDKRRDEFLAEKGIITVRIPSLDMFEDDGVIQAHWLKVIGDLCGERIKNS